MKVLLPPLLIQETIDENPFTGITYYRLKQTDYNHDFNYFDPIIVDAEKSDISVYNFELCFATVENLHARCISLCVLMYMS